MNREVPHRVLDEIVQDLPVHDLNREFNGPASQSQRAAPVRIHSNNPKDLARVQSFQHFQDRVIGATKDGLYIIADALERMFPHDSVRTKLLLGYTNAAQFLANSGATASKHPSLGTIFEFKLNSIMQNAGIKDVLTLASQQEFQDPFSGGDLLPPPPPPPPSLPPDSCEPGYWRTSMDFWNTIQRVGVDSFIKNLLVGFVDEVMGKILPEKYHGTLNYIRTACKGASLLIGTASLCMALMGKVTLLAAVTSVLIGFVGSYLGGKAGSALAKLLFWVKDNYLTSAPNAPQNLLHVQQIHSDIPPDNCEGNDGHSHTCGQENNNHLYIGLCNVCTDRPALFGFVHAGNNVAHSAFCLDCYKSPKLCSIRDGICICGEQASSTYWFDARTTTCSYQTCMQVGDCVTCDDVGMDHPNTACVWRVRKAKETHLTQQSVSLDVRYCKLHHPVPKENDIFRYGVLHSLGWDAIQL